MSVPAAGSGQTVERPRMQPWKIVPVESRGTVFPGCPTAFHIFSDFVKPVGQSGTFSLFRAWDPNQKFLHTVPWKEPGETQSSPWGSLYSLIPDCHQISIKLFAPLTWLCVHWNSHYQTLQSIARLDFCSQFRKPINRAKFAIRKICKAFIDIDSHPPHSPPENQLAFKNCSG